MKAKEPDARTREVTRDLQQAVERIKVQTPLKKSQTQRLTKL